MVDDAHGADGDGMDMTDGHEDSPAAPERPKCGGDAFDRGEWGWTLDEAARRFEGQAKPRAAALEWIRQGQAHRTHLVKKDFVVFMAMGVWMEMGLSCEVAFEQLFEPYTRATLYRWKKQVGYTDAYRSRKISEGKAKVQQCAVEPADCTIGAQLALPYFEAVASGFTRVILPSIRKALGHRRAATDDELRQFDALCAEVRAAMRDGRV